MTPSNKSQLVVLLIILILLSIVTITDESSVNAREKSVYAGDTATFSFCAPNYVEYNINDLPPWSLPFNEDISFTSENNCHNLTFPARPELDNATVSFLFSNGSTIKFLLHVQDYLRGPYNFTYEEVNSTHIILVWDEPFSRVKPANINYTLTLEGSDTETIFLTTTNFTIPRPPEPVNATLTPKNLVGEGENTTIFLSFICEKQGEITTALKGLPYKDQGVVSVRVDLFTLQDGVAYCIPSSVTLIHEDKKRVVTIRYMDKRAYVVVHNVTEERHVRDLLIWYPSHLYIEYSTYKVQDVEVTGDTYEKLLQCFFLSGTEHNTCFIEVDGHEELSLSGSDVYNFSKPGNYTFRVYDDSRQRDMGLEPAKVLYIHIGDKTQVDSGFPWDITGGAVGGCIAVFSLAFGLVLLLYKHKQSEKGHMEITSPDEDKTTENNHKSTELLPEIQQHGSAVDNRENPVHQATEEGRDDLEIGKGVRRTQRTIAHYRENHVAISIEETECDKVSTKTPPTIETQQVSSDHEKEVDVEVGDLPTPELHPAPVEEQNK